MTAWKQTLDLSDVWKLAKSGALPLPQLCSTIADRVEQLKSDTLFPRLDLVDKFRELALVSDLEEDEFDEVFEELYDFADRDRIWVRLM